MDIKNPELDWTAPSKWFVVFHRRATTWWVNWLALGRFKHVSAFGYSEVAGAWVLIDYHLRRTKVLVIPDRFMKGIMVKHCLDAEVVEIEPMEKAWPVVGLCSTSIAHLIGLPGCALRPDALFRQCLANGGKLLGDNADENRGQSSEAKEGEGGGSAEAGADGAVGSRDRAA